MSRVKRIESLIRLRHNEVADIERRLAQSSQDLALAERQHAELTAARDEYSRRLQGSGCQQISGSEVKILLVFLQRLDEALKQLDTQMTAQRKTVRDWQQRWITARHKTQALNDIADRYRQLEQAAMLQREQRENDDRPRPLGNFEQEYR